MRRLVPLSAILLALALVALLTQPSTRLGASLKLASTVAASHMTGITTITTDTILILTYSYATALFTATNTTYNIPYPWLHWGEYDKTGRTKTDKPYTRLTLENDYLRISLLPELGGRVYEMVFKPTGNDELYKNPVVKPTNWGPPEQGWWLAAGGIEWGLPVEEHGYESAIPWSYSIAQSSEGITVTLRDSTAPDRLRASVDVFLPSNRAVLILRPRIENARSIGLDFKWWVNAMLAPGPSNTVGPDLRFIFPVDAITVHSTNDDRLPGHGWPGPSGPTESITWPIYSGVDWSRLGNFDEWFGFFGRPQAQQDFVGVYDTPADEGVVRVFPHAVATGIKGFAMGWLNPIGSNQWTDDGSYYVELHGGLAPTFWDSVHLNAGESIEWEETWYSIAGIGPVTTANAEAALRVEQSGSVLHLGVFSTRARSEAHLSVWQRSTCGQIADFENDEWGDAFTSVLLSPAAVMETSRKSAPTFFGPGQSVGYQIVLSNTGNLAGNIALADAVPLSMTLLTGTLSASSGPAPIFDGARITWTGSVAQGEAVLITYALTPTIGLGFMQPQTNRVIIEGGVVPVTRTAVASMARIVYLPIAMRSFTP